MPGANKWEFKIAGWYFVIYFNRRWGENASPPFRLPEIKLFNWSETIRTFNSNNQEINT